MEKRKRDSIAGEEMVGRAGAACGERTEGPLLVPHILRQMASEGTLLPSVKRKISFSPLAFARVAERLSRECCIDGPELCRKMGLVFSGAINLWSPSRPHWMRRASLETFARIICLKPEEIIRLAAAEEEMLSRKNIARGNILSFTAPDGKGKRNRRE